MIRGNGGQNIFFDADDRHHFYLLLQAGVSCYGHRIHCFCCMSNHVHLVIQVADQSLSKVMQNLSFRYTRWINKRQGRTGHLFQGRFKAILIDADEYLLELVRYIHLNPLRAGLVKQVDKYPWSSHAAYAGKQELPWLTTDWVYGHFSRQRAACIRQYLCFISEGTGERYRKEFHEGGADGRILGEDTFTENILGQLDTQPMKPPSLDKIIDVVCTVCGVNKNGLSKPTRQRKLAQARGLIAWFVVDKKSETLTKVVQAFNRDLSTISFAVRRIEENKASCKILKRRMILINSLISQACPPFHAPLSRQGIRVGRGLQS